MSQHQYLVDRYASSLTKYDVQELFERLKDKCQGNVTAATKEADIQRKTVYDWENNSENIKASTKRKILEASLKTDLYGTMNFLIRKNAMNYHEALDRYISMNCDEITSTNDPQELQEQIMNFEKFLKFHSGAIHDIKTIPIEEMIDSINQKSDSLGVKGITRDISFMSPNQISHKFIDLLEVFRDQTLPKTQIPDTLGLPKGFVDRACRTINYFDPPSEATEDVFNLYSEGSITLVSRRPLLERPAHERFPSYLSSRKG